jgi:hypothetical protein
MMNEKADDVQVWLWQPDDAKRAEVDGGQQRVEVASRF